MIRSALMNVMTAAALKAGRGLKRDFGEVENLQVSVKGPGDFVTAADRRAERTVFEELSKARPGYGFVMEESGEVEGTDKSHTWYIDPLDGTTNFLHGIPIFGVSIGLAREGQMIAGIVYNPGRRRHVRRRARAGRLSQQSPPARLRPPQARRLRHRMRHSASRQAA